MENPRCYGMEELPTAVSERARVCELLQANANDDSSSHSPLFVHLSHGLAYTVGSALGSTPPSVETCLAAFLVPNKAGLTAGARAWSKHAHRSLPQDDREDDPNRREASTGWWGTPSGSVTTINEKALVLFHKVMNNATWRNLHWLPYCVLVYEVRVPEGYGMRWSQDQSNKGEDEERPWSFRGYVEPMMENGHEVGWRH
jgi:hypothetical protein